jgi:HK97 family phage portal protein
MRIRDRFRAALRRVTHRLSRETPVRRPVITPVWHAGQAAPWADDTHEQTRHYAHWVYAATRAIASKIAGAELTVHVRRAGLMEEVADPGHPLVRLLEEVNPLQTRYSLWEGTVMFLELTGNAYWYVAENGLGVPAELWLIPSQHMRVIPDERDFIRGYVCRGEGVEQTFSRHEIIHLRYSNPRSQYYGRGPLQAAAASVDAFEKIKQAESAAFEHGLMTQLALETDQNLALPTLERIRTQIQQKFAGVKNAGRPIVLEGGLHAKPISIPPREMAFLQSARLTRDEILGIFGVPAAIMGLSEDVNRSVAEAMDVIFARYCIEPKLRLIEAQLNQDLARRFDPQLVCRFRPVVPEDRDQNRSDMETNLRHGVTTINEERRRQGRPPVLWGDKPILPGNVRRMGDEKTLSSS